MLIFLFYLEFLLLNAVENPIYEMLQLAFSVMRHWWRLKW